LEIHLGFDEKTLLEVKIPRTGKEPIEIYTGEELQTLLKKPNIMSCSLAIYHSWVIVNFLLLSDIRQNSFICDFVAVEWVFGCFVPSTGNN